MNLQKSLQISFFIFFIPAIFHSTIHDPMRKTVNTNIKPHISIYGWLSRAFPLTSQCNIHLYIGGQVELNPGPVKYPCGIYAPRQLKPVSVVLFATSATYGITLHACS